MGPGLFDSHAHLDFADFGDDVEAVLDRARAAGVAGVVTVGSGRGLGGNDAAVALANRHGDVWAAVGIHPHDARLADAAAMERVGALLDRDRVVAVGETGLDYRYDRSPRSEQRAAFVAHVRLAREMRLPLVVHSREAEADTMAILEGEGAADAGGVLHCFSGGDEMARRALAIGLRISFSGVITFPKADALRAVARDVVPLDRTLIETDAPFLAPVPRRGRRNEPAYVVHTAAKLAEIHGVSIGDVARITTLAARDLFRLTS